MKPHYNYINRAKALAIFFVVIGHVWYFCINGCEHIDKPRFFSIFQMPLFMLLSGLLCKFKFETFSDMGGTLFKKFRRILVPFFVFGLCYCTMINHSFIELITHNMKYGYWYLWVLFEFYIFACVYTIISKYVSNIILDILIAILLYIPIIALHVYGTEDVTNFFSVNQMFKLYPYFMLGVFLSKYGITTKIFSNNSIYTLMILLSVIALLFIPTQLYRRNIILSFSITFLICCILYQYEDSNSKIFTIMDYLGGKTLDIYVLHYFFIKLLNLQWMSDFFKGNSYSFMVEFVVCAVSAVFIIAFSLLVSTIIRKSIAIDKLIFNGRQ